ncbi:hypothetical protein ACFPK1_11905 [Actinomycetospora rhizophila]|uniref:Uncharacterized protein n=1 Tax=Actinomycetospora rhizophila TaxID=1416876 RepID=A0ABV9ZEX8_9PSEU
MTAPTIGELLARYRTRFAAGSPGHDEITTALRGDVLTLSAPSLEPSSLDAVDLDDLIAYSGWNVWDMLGSRATEGESGLIPRQEYETIAGVAQFAAYPDVFARITEAVGGADGVVELGATARREIGTKVNLLHAWCCCMPLLTGRGFTTGLGLASPADRGDALATALQFPRRLYRGLWGDEGPMFATGRGYRAPLLAGSGWLERFRDDVTWFDDDRERAATRRSFNAMTQLFAFLLHLDNRLGLADSGPYPQPDGTVLVVRDHFLHDPAYPWFEVSADLPHAVTQALFFRPPEGMRFTVNDLSTTFTDPGDYLPHLAGTAVYARDRWDTPVGDVRLLGEDELEPIATAARTRNAALYARYARMSRDELIMAGVQMYTLDFVLPFLRLAGLADEPTLRELGLRLPDRDALGPLAQASYPLLTDAGTAGELLPRVLIAGEGFVPVHGDDPVAAP